MNIVDKLMLFRDTQDISVLNLECCINHENLNVIVIELLAWLRLQRKRELWIEEGRKAQLKPMTLKKEFPWCNELVIYTSQSNIFGEYFSVHDNKLDFRRNISEEIIHQLREYAYEKYIPEIHC